MSQLAPPQSDDELPDYIAALGLPGIIDIHVHFMPDRVQQKVWGFFDRLPEMGEPAWPIAYRHSEDQRVRLLRKLGVTAFGTLNYAHRPGMAEYLNQYSHRFAARHEAAIHSASCSRCMFKLGHSRRWTRSWILRGRNWLKLVCRLSCTVGPVPMEENSPARSRWWS